VGPLSNSADKEWMVPSAHANQLPLPTLSTPAIHVSTTNVRTAIGNTLPYLTCRTDACSKQTTSAEAIARVDMQLWQSSSSRLVELLGCFGKLVKEKPVDIIQSI